MTSFSFIYSCCFCYLFLDIILGKHSFIHLFQTSRTISWILCYIFFGWHSPLSTESCANSLSILPCRKWFGIIRTSSSGFAVWYVSGLELMGNSAPVTAIISSSSVILGFPKTALIAVLAGLIIDSCTPPKWGARGGLKYHLMPLWLLDSFIFVLPKASTSSPSSLFGSSINILVVVHQEFEFAISSTAIP